MAHINRFSFSTSAAEESNEKLQELLLLRGSPLDTSVGVVHNAHTLPRGSP